MALSIRSSTGLMSSTELPKVHPRSQVGFAEGKAELYDIARPSYPAEALTAIRNALPRKEGLRVVEIACGTGKLTKSLLAHPEFGQSLTELRCIEPNEGMRAVFTKTVSDPRASLANGTFDKIGVPDGWADLVIIAMAFHWCLDLEAALNEFTRVLKLDGVVCLLWNMEDTKKAPWLKQIYDICMPYRDNTPASAAEWERWRQMFDLPAYKENFTPAEETTVPFSELRTLGSIIDLFMSWAGIAVLPDKEREAVKEQIKDIVRRGEGLVWKDEQRGVFEAPFIVDPLVIFRRKTHSEGIVPRLLKRFV